MYNIERKELVCPYLVGLVVDGLSMLVELSFAVFFELILCVVVVLRISRANHTLSTLARYFAGLLMTKRTFTSTSTYS